MKKVIVRMKGGLGNQLFSYCASRRLALANEAELVIDNISGFSDDKQFRHYYALDSFNISSRIATPAERLEPFSRYRRGAKKWVSRRSKFENRSYIEQEDLDRYEPRLLSFVLKKNVYIEGYWQSEAYFRDIEDTIRKDLIFNLVFDPINLNLAEKIRNSNSVMLHVRWFDKNGFNSVHNLPLDYYQKAIQHIEANIKSPHYYLFSNYPRESNIKLDLPSDRVTVVENNKGFSSADKDLWLMSQCRHFILANSTFSWWGAWLAQFEGKSVIAPNIKSNITSPWKYYAEVPGKWKKI